MFPGVPSNVLEDNLQVYIDRASTDGRITAVAADAQDNLTRLYALYLIFNDAYLEMNNRPLNVNVAEKGSHGFAIKQIQNMQDQANMYLAAFNDLLPVQVNVGRRGANYTARNVFGF